MKHTLSLALLIICSHSPWVHAMQQGPMLAPHFVPISFYLAAIDLALPLYLTPEPVSHLTTTPEQLPPLENTSKTNYKKSKIKKEPVKYERIHTCLKAAHIAHHARKQTQHAVHQPDKNGKRIFPGKNQRK